MRGWWEEFAGLVLPAACGGCGTPRTAVCGRCRAALCEAGARRVRPDPAPAGLPGVWAAAAYEDAVRALLLAHKERGALGLAGVLGAALAQAVRPVAALHRAGGTGSGAWGGRGGGLVLVPVPSLRRAVRARGHDPVLRIARAAAGRLRAEGLPVRVAPVLRPTRVLRDQAGLSARERFANLRGALEVRPREAALLVPRTGAGAGADAIAGAGARTETGAGAGAVVLVDDLITTGATIAEAARALRAADVEGVLTTVRTAKDVGATKSRTVSGELSQEVFGDGPGRPLPREIMAAVVAASPTSFEINRN